MNRNRAQAERKGRTAETIAVWYLRAKGYRLLAQRFKSPVGEIDLIMRRGDTTVFIEVKARSTVDDAIISVTEWQARRISAAARSWMMKDHKAATGFSRFDIVAVPSYLWPTHIENAFSGER
jgi:putative endonuclease